MNDETQELLKQLELATSTSPVDRSALDPETAAMRESWLLLGRMLKGAETAEWTAVPARATPELWTAPARRRSFRAWWVLGSVLSAVAAATVWWLVAGGTITPPGSPANKSVAHPSGPAATSRQRPNESSGTSATVASPAVPDAEAPNAGGTDWSSALAWEDGWEDGLSRTSQVVEQFREPRRTDAPLQWLESEFQELAREFDASSL